MSGKNKEFLFFISKKRDVVATYFVTRNFNESQSLNKRTDCVYETYSSFNIKKKYSYLNEKHAFSS